ncbi:hypothetical protein [Natronorarus salvus]|uniref:hypothetical protein n=1 Tax=Natronorarus salvus TaxID=3117733 RepID=UPI002F263D6A
MTSQTDDGEIRRELAKITNERQAGRILDYYQDHLLRLDHPSGRTIYVGVANGSFRAVFFGTGNGYGHTQEMQGPHLAQYAHDEEWSISVDPEPSKRVREAMDA